MNDPNVPYRVLARKYRPENFDDLIGQDAMVRTLSNGFASGRIAQAYMLTGVRGVGKTTTARILARALNFADDKTDGPQITLDRLGEHCQAIMEGRHVDVIEMDAASHTGIDDIRDIIESVQYAPALARYKVYIIDEVHMLSRNAFNGLLKTLEEPPAHLKFIFATTEIRKVPVTVLSRCQRFDLRRIEAQTLSAHLEKICGLEKVEAEDEALGMIARAAEGSVRDALSMLDQVIAHAGSANAGSANAGDDGDTKIIAEDVRNMLGLADRSRVIDLFEQIMAGDIGTALDELKDQYDKGADPYVVLSDLADFIHAVTRMKYADGNQGAAAISSMSEVEAKRGREFAEKLSVRVLGRAWQILLKGLDDVRGAERPLGAADMLLVQLTHAVDLPPHEELLKMAKPGTGTDQAGSKHKENDNTSNGPDDGDKLTGLQSGKAATLPSEPQMNVGAAPGGDGPLSAATRHKPEAGIEQNDRPQLELKNFEDLIGLADEKRDLKIKTYLHRNVRFIAIRPGHFEFNQIGDPPRDSVQRLQKFLEAHTNMRWTLAISQDEGLPSIAEIEQAEQEHRLERARANPIVEAILKRFEGARIVDVRIQSEPDDNGIGYDDALPDPEADSGDEGLGGFFEEK